MFEFVGHVVRHLEIIEVVAYAVAVDQYVGIEFAAPLLQFFHSGDVTQSWQAHYNKLGAFETARYGELVDQQAAGAVVLIPCSLGCTLEAGGVDKPVAHDTPSAVVKNHAFHCAVRAAEQQAARQLVVDIDYVLAYAPVDFHFLYYGACY